MFRIANINRLRINTDGEGVRTLVALQGCLLKCKYCINPHTWKPDESKSIMTAEELYKKIALDRPYFMATGGGVTFGGGEPLLQAGQIAEFKRLCGEDFTIFAETSLFVPTEFVKTAAQCVERFYVDIKMMDSRKYREYTGGNIDEVQKNLQLLLNLVGNERIVLRVPEIPGFTTADERKYYRQQLEEMGVTHFDLFTYRV